MLSLVRHAIGRATPKNYSVFDENYSFFIADLFVISGDMARAVDTLELWLQKNSTFSGIPTLTLEEPQEDSRSPLSVSSLFRFQSKSEDLLKLFEQALMVSPQDVNVLTAVGILNCVRNDYATAANIFR